MSQADSTRNITGVVCVIVGIALTIGLYGSSSDDSANTGLAVETPAAAPPPVAAVESVQERPTTEVEASPGVVREAELPATVPVATPATKLPVWEAWEKPALALLLTGEQHGYFEPCGCTSNQLGGMSRRADLVGKLKTAGWETRGLDVGGLSRRTSRQASIKLNTTLKALYQLRYEGVAVGLEELQLGVENLLEVHMNASNREASVPFVCANVTFLDGALDGFPTASRVFEAGGMKIGMTGVVGEKVQREVLPLPDVTWTDPVPELEKVMSGFDQQQVDVRILLSHASVVESIAYAEKFPTFDIVLTARGTGDPDPEAAPHKVGTTLIVEAGSKGKHVGVLGIYPNAQQKFRFKLVSLERADFDDTPAMVTLMQGYQNELKEFEIAREDTVGNPHPSGATFVGADACGECHTTAYEIWKGTPHSHALESLDPVHKRLGYERLNGVNRSWDPECLACHVTGWDPVEYVRFQSGFLNEEFARTDEEKILSGLLAGSQCENCHGPGSHHIEQVNADMEDAGKSVRVTLEAAKKNLCTKCHDSDNSPEFEFDKYWKKVEHYGLD